MRVIPPAAAVSIPGGVTAEMHHGENIHEGIHTRGTWVDTDSEQTMDESATHLRRLQQRFGARPGRLILISYSLNDDLNVLL